MEGTDTGVLEREPVGCQLGMMLPSQAVVQTCDPRIQKIGDEDCEFQENLGYTAKPLLKTRKNFVSGQVRWEAEAS